jgi:hypothetical protein
MSSIEFYESLPVLPRFIDAIDPIHYRSLPDDWYVAITDVRNSTIAIDAGKYKEVNAMGAVSIMAVLNLTGKYNFPFIFGGDGSTMCIPPELYDGVVSGLKAVRIMAKESFELDLRCAIIPIVDVHQAGHDINVAKYGVSSYYSQATFGGGGIQYAENLLKDDSAIQKYDVDKLDALADGDLTGLECRWDEVPNKRGEVHSLLIEVLEKDPSARIEIYREIFERINVIYGSEDEYKPVTLDGLRLTLSNNKLSVERRVRTYGKETWDKVKYWLKLRIQWLLGIVLMRFGIKTENVDWSRYKPDLVDNTDYRKLDDMLRLVLAGTEIQRFTLQGYLEELYMQDKVVYGLHHASSALITCVILNHDGGHIHLVDGSDGGYAKAAAKLKLRKKRIS